MPATQSWPNRDADPSPFAMRQALAGDVMRLNDGTVRAGLFWRGVSAIAGPVAGQMQTAVTWQTAAAQADTNGRGVQRLAIDATTIVTHDPAPTSGRRIDLVYLRANDTEQGDPNSLSIITIEKGVSTTGTPARPTLPPRAIELVEVEIAAGATTMAAAIYRQTAPFTTAADGILPVRSQTEREALTNLLPIGSTVFQIDTAARWGLAVSAIDGSPTWVHEGGRPLWQALAFAGIYSGSALVGQQDGRVILSRTVNGTAAFNAGETYTVGTVPAALAPAVDHRFTCAANGNITAVVFVGADGRVLFALSGTFTGGLQLSLAQCSWVDKRLGG